jgi:signal transduction histidine kinase
LISTPLKIFIIAGIIVILLSLIIFYTAYLIIEEEKRMTFLAFSNSVTLLTNAVSAKLDNAIRIIELSSTRNAITNISYANFISEEYKGIPEDKDIQKRQAARIILEEYPEFEFMVFSMPNGDVYMLEPYENQYILPHLNFADRDWYRDTIEKKDTYVSEVYRSTTVGHNIIEIRTPVYGNDGSLIGIWGGALNLSFLEAELKDIVLGDNIRVLFYDRNGKIVLDTSAIGSEPDDFPHEQIIDAVSESPKTFVLDNPHMLISHDKLMVGTTSWTIVVTQPYNDAFTLESMIMGRTFVMIVSLLSIVGFSSYFTYRMFKANLLLTEKLRQVDKEKEEFSAMVTHELKTPLIPVSGYAELFLDGSLGNMTEIQKEKMQVIYENSIRLSTLIQDILDVRKIELDKLHLILQNESIRRIVERSIDIFRPIANQRDIVILNETQDVVVKCDSDRILQVINNVISNAIKFVPEQHGTISINSRIEGELVVIGITDNGIGIPKAKQDDLFKKFYQVDKSMTRKSGGTGLGLAICKGIIESHGGKIWIESEENHGTSVYFTLPRGDIT